MVIRYPLIWLIIIALASTIVIAACAPKIETPPAAESRQLFFKPLTYINDEYGFSIKYPDTYKEIKSQEQGDILFYASGPLGNTLPVLLIRKMNSNETEGQKADLVRKQYGFIDDLSVKSLDDITLADGKIKGKIFLYVWSMVDTPMRKLELVVAKDDYAIGTTIMSPGYIYNEKRYLDILRTFNLK
jgi:hypothetical protein